MFLHFHENLRIERAFSSMQVNLLSSALCYNCVGFKRAYFYVFPFQSILSKLKTSRKWDHVYLVNDYITSVPDSAWNISVEKYLLYQ